MARVRYLLMAALTLVFVTGAGAQDAPLAPCDPRNAHADHEEAIPIPPALETFDGAWLGQLQGAQGKGLYPACAWNLTVRLHITGSRADVQFKDEKGAWRSFDSAAQVSVRDTNAVVSATHSASNWVETWVFVLSKRDNKTALATWNRVVNNYGTNPTHGERVYAFAAAGELALESEK